MKLTERQREHVMAYLDAHAKDEALRAPLKALGELLLNDFGIPKTEGCKIARTIICELEGAGRVRCAYSINRSLRTVQILLDATSATPPRCRQVALTEATPSPSRMATEATVPTPAPVLLLRHKGPRHTPKKLRKGEARRERQARERGDRNESRCYRIADRLVRRLQLIFREKITSAQCTRSGRHNPKKGKINRADHCGEDVGIALAARLDDRTILRGRVVLDAKSSEAGAAEFNRDIRFGGYERKTDVIFKRAIAVHPKRTDLEIAKELLTNIAAAGFSFVVGREEMILQEFQSF